MIVNINLKDTCHFHAPEKFQRRGGAEHSADDKTADDQHFEGGHKNAGNRCDEKHSEANHEHSLPAICVCHHSTESQGKERPCHLDAVHQFRHVV